MSNIPRARALLNAVLAWELEDDVRSTIGQALELMARKKPAFVAKRSIKPLSPAQKAEAQRLRTQGMPINDIARQLKTNLGRVSEACSN